MNEVIRRVHCSLFDLAPGGVCLARLVTQPAGEPLPHRFTLTSRAGGPARRSTFCCTFPGLAAGGRYPSPCPAQPGLSSRRVPLRADMAAPPGPRPAAIRSTPNSTLRILPGGGKGKPLGRALGRSAGEAPILLNQVTAFGNSTREKPLVGGVSDGDRATLRPSRRQSRLPQLQIPGHQTSSSQTAPTPRNLRPCQVSRRRSSPSMAARTADFSRDQLGPTRYCGGASPLRRSITQLGGSSSRKSTT